MKILYFTGTGNSLSVAKRFDAELLSIPKMVKNNIYEISDDVVGIVYPVYAISMPDIVRKYLSRCKINANYVFVIATYGSMACGSLNEMKQLLKVNGNRADYYASLLMIDNYLPFFDVEKQLANLNEKNIENNLKKIVEDVNSRVQKEEKVSLFNKFASKFGNSVVQQIKSHTPKMFYVNDKCVSCGLCKKLCPVKNITQNEMNKIVFGNVCESCLSCIHNCPQNAIHLKNQRSEKRYRNSDVSLNEIINSNEQ